MQQSRPPASAAPPGAPGAPGELTVERFVCGPLANNVYLATAPGGAGAIVVDPALESWPVVGAALRERGLTLELIVATHAHWDHVAEARVFADATGAPVAAHRLDAPLLSQPAHPMLFPEMEIPAAPVARELYEGDVIVLGAQTLVVWHTPGHSPGSICLYCAASATLISGDTLFAGSFGRYDLPGGDVRLLRSSLQRLATLPAHTAVLPGHGPATTIGDEAWLQRIAL